MPDHIEHVMVVGYGTMGRGIVASFAGAGFRTTVLSRNPARIDDLPHGAEAVDVPPGDAPDLIIESVPETMAIKRELLARMEAAYGRAPILASNTSSLPLDELADGLDSPARFIGVHYMHPADALPMVEVIRTSHTSDETLARTVAALERTGKDSIVLNRPVVGFLINRLQHAILHEAYYLISEGIVTAKDVDDVANWLLGPRMCVTGLIRQKDISGLDVHALVQRGLVPELCHSTESQPAIQRKFENGEFGIKAGVGFYDWRRTDVPDYRSKAAGKLGRLLAVLREDPLEVPELA